MPQQRNGILIAVEGIDGAGKSTQVQRLGEMLAAAGEAVVLSKEPTDGPWGQKIKASAQQGRLPLEEELQAFVEDRKQHVAQVIRPALDQGRIVILDRYFYSTIAYQGARGADVEQLTRQMVAIAPVPDLVFLLDIDPAAGLRRIADSRGEIPNEFETLESLAKVREIFNRLAARHANIRVIDAAQSEDEIYAAMARLLNDGPLAQRRA